MDGVSGNNWVPQWFCIRESTKGKILEVLLVQEAPLS
jgi:hypothetical protein